MLSAAGIALPDGSISVDAINAATEGLDPGKRLAIKSGELNRIKRLVA
jgi:hypothetical protein